MNISKMGIKYNKPAEATRSGFQAGSASHTTAPSVSGTGDQEADSHVPSRAPRQSIAQRTMMAELREEIFHRLPETLLAPLRAEYDGALQQQGQRIQGIEDRLGRVEAKLDLIINHFQIPQPPPQGNLLPPPPPNPPPPPPNQLSLPPPNTQQPQQPAPQNNQQPQTSPRNDHQPSPHNSPSPQNSPSHSNTSNHQNFPNHS